MLILGTQMIHLDLVRNGATFIDAEDDPQTCGITSVIPEDTASWVKLGSLNLATDLPQIGQVININRPKANGGTLELAKQIYLGPVSRVITLTAVDFSAFTVELAAMAGAIDDSGTATDALTLYTPFGGDADPIKGWWRLRWYDESDVLVRREVLWGELRMVAALTTGGAAAVTPQFVLTVFKNAQNKGWLVKRLDP